ncbi:MAG: hypothetical protein WA058_02250 [Minisyncoccia bacterium]
MHETSAVALFNRFLPKFKGAIFTIAAIEPMDPMPRRIFFTPKRVDECYTRGFHYISISRDVKFSVHFVYDEMNKQELGSQLLDAVWKAVLAGPFAGRKFYAKPAEGSIEKAFRQHAQHGSFGGEIPIEFSYGGDRIPGLHLLDNMVARSPFFFIPKKTPEGRVLHAALQLEEARLREERRARSGERPVSFGFLQEGLAEALAAVPA